MTKSELLGLESSLIEKKSLFIGDKAYSLSKEDVICLYKELAYAVEYFIKDNNNFNPERSDRDREDLLKNYFIKNLEEFSFNYCFEEEPED